jgi:ABC-type Fe3+/spermidine/putrescine transport system ATPase subunit
MVGELNVIEVKMAGPEKSGRGTVVRLQSGALIRAMVTGETSRSTESMEGWLCVRPKYVEAVSPEEGLVTGVVRQVQYVGGTFRVYAQVAPDQTEIKALVGDSGRTPHVGETVGVRFDERRCVLVYE